MNLKELYSIHPVDRNNFKEWILLKHYAKRMPPVQHSFGLFKQGELVGVITFGTPVSNPLRNLWKGEFKVMELNRLVINEGLEENSLSFFVSNALKLLPKPMVLVSYADTAQNHHGYIYQATNWIYTGLSIPFKDYYLKGKEHLHNGTIMDMYRGQKNRIALIREKYGDDVIMIERPRKHRYFFFIGNKKQVKKMREMLPYEVQPYPKGDNKRYDASYKPTVQKILI